MEETKVNNEVLARLDERMAFIQEKVVRIETAVFGNGKPGIRTDMNELAHKVSEIEKFERTVLCSRCKKPLGSVEETVEEIDKRHAEEDAAEQKVQARKDKEASEAIKFKWVLITMVATSAINITTGLFGK